LKKKSDIRKVLTGQGITESEKPFSDQLKAGMSAAGIAHDLNNILATISGYAEMLQEDLPGSSPLAENASRIVAAVAKARSLTAKMLVIDQQAGINNIPVDVNEILIESIDLTRPTFPPDIKINADISIVKVNVLADPTQLFRVFLNLITNAVQSMEKRGGTVSISLRVIDGNNIKSLLNRDIIAEEYTVVTFKDTGTGINTSNLQKIFEPFFTTRRAGEGTGLGLSVVREIVTGMEGEIIVSSKENEGSVFNVYLPVFKETTA
jgi:signal transduction histidine kinase